LIQLASFSIATAVTSRAFGCDGDHGRPAAWAHLTTTACKAVPHWRRVDLGRY
jgi:hypothetical protein